MCQLRCQLRCQLKQQDSTFTDITPTRACNYSLVSFGLFHYSKGWCHLTLESLSNSHCAVAASHWIALSVTWILHPLAAAILSPPRREVWNCCSVHLLPPSCHRNLPGFVLLRSVPRSPVITYFWAVTLLVLQSILLLGHILMLDNTVLYLINDQATVLIRHWKLHICMPLYCKFHKQNEILVTILHLWFLWQLSCNNLKKNTTHAGVTVPPRIQLMSI